MRMPSRILFLLALTAALGAPAGPSHALERIENRLPVRVPADSLVPVLRKLETGGPKSTSAAAAFTLGQLHHARGEYRLAAEAFGRAAARLQGYDRAEARYRAGLAWLGAEEGGRARAAFEEVSTLSQPLRPLAQLGLSQALALTGEAARELEVLRRLLDGPAGEAEPAALERYAILCDRAHRSADAVAARERLLRRWPRSLEAGRLAVVAPGAQP